MSLGQEDISVKIFLIITEQSVEDIHKGNCQGRQVHHNMSMINFIPFAVPNVHEGRLHLAFNELSCVFVETLNIVGALLV